MNAQDKYSNYKILAYPNKIEDLKASITSAPLYVRIKPVNFCNHDCFFCVYAKTARKQPSSSNILDHVSSGMHEDIDLRDSIPNNKLIEIANDIVSMGVKAVTFSGGGEPLMHPRIREAMTILLDGKVKISAITNGQLLSKSSAAPLLKASWVRVSIDYANADEMVASRNVPETYFASVLDSLEYFAENKSAATDLFVNYIVHKNNCDNLLPISRILKERGVENIRFSPMWVPDYIEYHAAIVDKVVHQIAKAREELEDDVFSISSTYDFTLKEHGTMRGYNRCFIMETIPVIGADLNVYACHNKAYDKSGIVCSIKERTFREAWFDPDTRTFFDNFNAAKTCQHQCSNDTKNMILNDIVNTSYDPFI